MKRLCSADVATLCWLRFFCVLGTGTLVPVPIIVQITWIWDHGSSGYFCLCGRSMRQRPKQTTETKTEKSEKPALSKPLQSISRVSQILLLGLYLLCSHTTIEELRADENNIKFISSQIEGWIPMRLLHFWKILVRGRHPYWAAESVHLQVWSLVNSYNWAHTSHGAYMWVIDTFSILFPIWCRQLH